MITATARAKVNLCLHVTGKRPDGYHLLESLVVFAECGDDISVECDKELSLEISGPFADGTGLTDDNLVLKAAHLLRTESGANLGAKIRLVKNLPVAAGLGGGSADAAEALKLLNRLWKTGFSARKLADMGLSLGADVPVCLLGRPVLMSGIGEHLREIPTFPKLYILLVNIGVTVSTAEVFRRLELRARGDMPPIDRFMTAEDVLDFLENTRNDLETPARDLAPDIAMALSVIGAQDGCRLVRMSGSGATCFGLFETEDKAAIAASAIQSHYPDWWVRACPVSR